MGELKIGGVYRSTLERRKGVVIRITSKDAEKQWPEYKYDAIAGKGLSGWFQEGSPMHKSLVPVYGKIR